MAKKSPNHGGTASRSGLRVVENAEGDPPPAFVLEIQPQAKLHSAERVRAQRIGVEPEPTVGERVAKQRIAVRAGVETHAVGHVVNFPGELHASSFAELPVLRKR